MGPKGDKIVQNVSWIPNKSGKLFNTKRGGNCMIAVKQSKYQLLHCNSTNRREYCLFCEYVKGNSTAADYAYCNNAKTTALSSFESPTTIVSEEIWNRTESPTPNTRQLALGTTTKISTPGKRKLPSTPAQLTSSSVADDEITSTVTDKEISPNETNEASATVEESTEVYLSTTVADMSVSLEEDISHIVTSEVKEIITASQNIASTALTEESTSTEKLSTGTISTTFFLTTSKAKIPRSTTPEFPMSEVEEVVAKVFQNLGCLFIIGSLSLTLGVFLLLRDFSYERFLHMNQEIALLIAHLLIMSARDKTGMPILCKLASIILHFTFMAAFSFMVLEALQTYAIMTSVVVRGGYFNRRQFFAIGWGGPALIAGACAVLKHDDYISHFSCWLNFDSRVAYASTVPICSLFAAAFVMAEAASMGHYPKIPGYDKNQATAAVANQKAMFLLLPLNLASWLCGAVAVHYANFAMYSLVSALNMSLGIAVFVFHSLGNPKVHAMFKKLWSKFF